MSTNLGPCLVEVANEERIGVTRSASLELLVLHLYTKKKKRVHGSL